ncbi:MAG: leucine-rich repeat protein, partial [Treponema sp.]|nr:leucine-rich repeat protein [Treponema sp.]
PPPPHQSYPHKKLATIIGALICVLFFFGCPADPEEPPPPIPTTPTTPIVPEIPPAPEIPPIPEIPETPEIKEYITKLANELKESLNGGSPGDPVAVTVEAINLDGLWGRLLTTIAEEGKYVALDLSACTMTGTEFDPFSTNTVGKGKIVSLSLPTAAESIKDGQIISEYEVYPTFQYFSALKEIHGSTIKSIGAYAFKSCDALVTADFPQATTIGNGAFRYCDALVEVNFPQTITIGNGAFDYCRALVEVDFPNVTSIGEGAFSGTALATANFPEATTIGEGAFGLCSALVEADFPQAITIGGAAFGLCSALVEADFPQAITIGINAFQECSALKTVNFPEATTIGDSAFDSCSALKTVNFPKVKTIGNYAFSRSNNYASNYCRDLVEVNFPEATTIGEGAFLGCDALVTANFPNAETPITPGTPPVTYLVTFNTNGGSTISAQTIIEGETATRPANPTKSGYSFVNWYADSTFSTLYNFNTPVSGALTVYARWKGYVTVTFNTNGGSTISAQTIVEGETATRPANPTKNGYSFVNWYANESLTTLYTFSTPVNSALTVYAKWGYYTNVTDIAAYLASVSGGGSANNPVLLTVDFNVSTNWASLLTTIQSANKYVALDLSACTMNGTEFDPDNTNATGKDKIVSLILPTAAQSIKGVYFTGYPVFKNFTALKEISGLNITTIGENAFANCSALVTANFPKATTIGEWAFRGCTALATADFPLATSIGGLAFHGCSALVTVNFPNVITIGESAFAICNALATVNFPEATTIGRYAFRFYRALKTASFPKATYIGEQAFCFTGTTSLEIKLGAEVPTLGTNIFLFMEGIEGYGTAYNTAGKPVTVKVPSGALSKYNAEWQTSFKGSSSITLTIGTY